MAVAGTIIDADIKPTELSNPRDYASFSRIISLYNLKKWDLALQYGEQYMKEFPASPYYQGVENLMRQMIDTRRKRDSERVKYLERIEEQQAGCRDKKSGDIRPERQVDYDLAPCASGGWASYTDDAVLASCRAFVAKYADATEARIKDKRATARFNIIMGLAERGNFPEARTLAEELLREPTAFETSLRGQIIAWPTD